MEFIHESNRIYLSDESNGMQAEVTFPETSAGVVNFNHTYVSPTLRGQGIAGNLLKAAADTVRTSQLKAYPTCSYAVAWFKKHPEYADILTTALNDK